MQNFFSKTELLETFAKLTLRPETKELIKDEVLGRGWQSLRQLGKAQQPGKRYFDTISENVITFQQRVNGPKVKRECVLNVAVPHFQISACPKNQPTTETKLNLVQTERADSPYTILLKNIIADENR